MASPLAAGLIDPTGQRLFEELAPNALASRFVPVAQGESDVYQIRARQTWQTTGARDNRGRKVATKVYTYGDQSGHSWPGRTIEAQSHRPVKVRWRNWLPLNQPHLLPVDTTFHWAYSLHGYRHLSIHDTGVPLVPHLHGGHTRAEWDGYPEAFFSQDFGVKGPTWTGNDYTYDNDQQAGALWYHDHTLGITRLNVYAGLAGFYIIRDDVDTRRHDNPLGLPAQDYELGYVIQDRMLRENGELFYPAFPGDPAWADFITDQGLADDAVPQPSGLAEFFGDLIMVNGVLWPKAEVEPRHYRVRLLNGSDSRFFALQLRATEIGSDSLDDAGQPLPFWVIGADQGLGSAEQMDHLLLGPSERVDLVIDFSQMNGRRLILSNTAGDAPFGGDLVADPDDTFPDRRTDRIMAFDVVRSRNWHVPDRFDPRALPTYRGVRGAADKVRGVALFEGSDEYGRLQPMLGTAWRTKDIDGKVQNGTMPWHAPITETPALGSTEVWEIYNTTMDAHPVHVHLVDFEILERHPFQADVVPQPVKQHDGAVGQGYRLENRVVDRGTSIPKHGLYERAPRDVVTAYPGEVTKIKMKWGRPGRYVWHCHILGHEDHDMMRPLEVQP